MGMIAELIKIASTAIKRWHSAPGNSVTITGTGLGGETVEAELYQLPGVFGRPAKEARGIFLSTGRGRRYGIVIATHDYRLNINIAAGETEIYSTDAGGALKAKILLKADGNIEINGSSKYLVTWGALNTALGNFITALNTALSTKLDGGGTPGVLSLDISGAKATSLRTDG